MDIVLAAASVGNCIHTNIVAARKTKSRWRREWRSFLDRVITRALLVVIHFTTRITCYNRTVIISQTGQVSKIDVEQQVIHTQTWC